MHDIKGDGFLSKEEFAALLRSVLMSDPGFFFFSLEEKSYQFVQRFFYNHLDIKIQMIYNFEIQII